MGFTVSERIAAAIKGLEDDRRLARSKIAIHPGGLKGAAQYLTEFESPQLLIVETADTGSAMFEALEGLAEVCDPDSKVILLGQENDISIYRQLMEMGLSEYYYGDIATDELIVAIENLFAEADASTLGRVIAFMGARGGVGSSSIAANTAYCLGQQFNEDVLLIDLDLAFGTSALAFNMQPRQTVADALSQPHRLDDVLMEKFMTKYADNLSIMPAPATLEGDHQIDFDSLEVVVGMGRRMASFVVLDLPHVWSTWMHETLLDVNEVVITSCLDLLTLRDTKNIFDLIGPKRGVDAPTRLVFNRMGEFKKTELSLKDFEEPVNVRPSASIMFDANLFGTAVNNGEMAIQVNKGSKVAKEFMRLANVVSSRTPVSKSGGKGKSLLSKLKGGK